VAPVYRNGQVDTSTIYRNGLLKLLIPVYRNGLVEVAAIYGNEVSNEAVAVPSPESGYFAIPA
jgi:hypothetical protein